MSGSTGFPVLWAREAGGIILYEPRETDIAASWIIRIAPEAGWSIGAVLAIFGSIKIVEIVAGNTIGRRNACSTVCRTEELVDSVY